MDKYQQIVAAIAAQINSAFRPASAESLEALRNFSVPQPVIEFYEKHEPETYAEGQQARLWNIEAMVAENTMAVPGMYVQPLGYIVFASTMYGDAYCFDLNQIGPDGDPQIVLISHEEIRDDDTHDRVKRVSKRVADSFLNFLEWFSSGQLDENCIYDA